MTGWDKVSQCLAEHSAGRSSKPRHQPEGRSTVQVRLGPVQRRSWALAADQVGCSLSDLMRVAVSSLVRWGKYRSQGDLVRAGEVLRGWQAMALRSYRGWRYEPEPDACPTCGRERRKPGAET